jgi:parallel beta-helix repeat protein
MLILWASAVSLASRTITVCPSGCDYSKIQEAIDAARPGDTISVGPGIYQENLTIAKSLRIIGSGREGTVIDGGGAEAVASIKADRVTFQGFGVRGGKVGILVEGVCHALLKDNRIFGNTEIGIHLHDSYENTLTGNLVESNGEVQPLYWGGHGIYLERAHGNNIVENVVSGNGATGIRLKDSHQNIITKNLLEDNAPEHYDHMDMPGLLHAGGIILLRSDFNTIEENILRGNTPYGIQVVWGSLNRVAGNRVEPSEREVHWMQLYMGIVIEGPSQCCEPGPNASSNTIEGNIVTGYEAVGLLLLNTDGNLVCCNRLEGSMIGLGLFAWDWLPPEVLGTLTLTQGNVIEANTIQKNSRGIFVMNKGGSVLGGRVVLGRNRIHWNNIAENGEFGLFSVAAEDLDARFNWWGDPSGPYHPEKNPEGKGNKVSDGVEFSPWLSSPVRWCD